jgi:ubiquinone biosynthesis protein UbiJ
MSLYGEAINALRSVILFEERLRVLLERVDRLADEVRDLKERLIRLETVIEVAKPGGVTLRIAPPAERGEEE